MSEISEKIAEQRQKKQEYIEAFVRLAKLDSSNIKASHYAISDEELMREGLKTNFLIKRW